MRTPVRVDTGFPSAAKTAKKLGVSKKVAGDLSSLAEWSLKTGEFVLPGVGRLVRGKESVRRSRSRAPGKVAAKKAVQARASKSANEVLVSSKKK